MNFTNLFKIAFKAIGNNKMRSFLTMLGIIIGVSSVIIMLALGHGSKETIKQNLNEMGSNMIFIRSGPDPESGVVWTPEMTQKLTLSDYQALVEQSKYLSAISPNVASGGQFVNGNNNYDASVNGVGIDYLSISRYSISTGAMFSENDIKTSAKVCVLGKTVVDKLFDNGADPIGQVIRFNNIPVRVVGVLKSKGHNTFGQDQDDIALMPYTTVMKRMLAVNYLQNIIASTVSDKMTQLAINDVTEILRTNHKLREDEVNDFHIGSQEELASQVDQILGVLTMLLSCIAGISLVVGGIGIMNIMYVSVTERTKEIGLRMSVGARGRDILTQFLIEAILISVTGGLIGVMIGAGISYLARFVLMKFDYDILISVQPWTVMLSFLICTITGVFFGWYPAKKAANLDPIEAIRYE